MDASLQAAITSEIGLSCSEAKYVQGKVWNMTSERMAPRPFYCIHRYIQASAQRCNPEDWQEPMQNMGHQYFGTGERKQMQKADDSVVWAAKDTFCTSCTYYLRDPALRSLVFFWMYHFDFHPVSIM